MYRNDNHPLIAYDNYTSMGAEYQSPEFQTMLGSVPPRERNIQGKWSRHPMYATDEDGAHELK